MELKRSKQSVMAYLNDEVEVAKVVEIAIKSLKDDQNRNVEYGSNLTVDGVVESNTTVIKFYSYPLDKGNDGKWDHFLSDGGEEVKVVEIAIKSLKHKWQISL